MGKKKTEHAGPSTKAKATSKDLSKKENFCVSANLANMPEKASSLNKPKPKPAPKASTYIDHNDLPTSDDDDSEEEQLDQKHRPDVKPLELSIAEKELKKRQKKDIFAAHVAEQARKEALRDDRDAFTVAIGDDDAHANVKDITIHNFSVSARGKELLKNASIKISHGNRYGLVGPNGMGKSTLLKHIAWREIPVPQNIDVLLVEQEVVGDDKTALEAVVSANAELVKLRQQVADLQNGKDDTNEDEDAGEKLAELYEKLQLMGSDAAEPQASKILAGLGFTKDMQGRPTKSFSGGWRMRISLARALFVQPTLLLLDEPTNHLDLRAVLWLEEYLCRWKKTLVVVSHDRDFLNTVCSEIIHLHDMKLHFYRGNFDAFESS
jgi:ATP-binding cassette subfamily F protein 1